MSTIQIAVYDAREYDERFLSKAFNGLKTDNGKRFKLHFISQRLGVDSAPLCKGCEAVCIFVSDTCNDKVIDILKQNGIKLILLRCAGFNNVDLKACKRNDITVLCVPQYSPYAVAEHAMSLFFCLNRHLNTAFNRVREGNFTINGLEGKDVRGLTCGVFGTGKIGAIFANMAHGVGMNVLLWDPFPNSKLAKEINAEYVKDKHEMLSKCDVISIHLPLIKGKTEHFIDEAAVAAIKPGCIIINCARGPIIDSKALLKGLIDGRIRAAGLDVYENEQGYFYEDCSGKQITDNVLARLTNMHNVIITSHQAFFTETALHNISQTTVENAKQFFLDGKRGDKLSNRPTLMCAPKPKL